MMRNELRAGQVTAVQPSATRRQRWLPILLLIGALFILFAFSPVVAQPQARPALQPLACSPDTPDDGGDVLSTLVIDARERASYGFVYNRSDDACYDIGLASYKEETNGDLSYFQSTVRALGPKEFRVLRVDIPCRGQVNLFRGAVLTEPPIDYGDRELQARRFELSFQPCSPGPTATPSHTPTPSLTPSNTPTQTSTPTATEVGPTPTPEFQTHKGGQVYRDASPTPRPGEVRPGDRIAYTVLVTNTGTVDARVVTISDTIPSGTTYLPGTAATNGSSLTVGNPIVAVMNQLVPSQVLSLTFTVIVNDLPVGTRIDNCAVILNSAADPPDPPCITYTVSDIMGSPEYRYYLPVIRRSSGN